MEFTSSCLRRLFAVRFHLWLLNAPGGRGEHPLAAAAHQVSLVRRGERHAGLSFAILGNYTYELMSFETVTDPDKTPLYSRVRVPKCSGSCSSRSHVLKLKDGPINNNRYPELRNRKMYRYDPVDVHLDVILSALAGGGSRSGPAVSFPLSLPRQSLIVLCAYGTISLFSGVFASFA